MPRITAMLCVAVFALAAAEAQAQCLKYDCASDPAAWGAATGGLRSEQEAAARAARAVVEARQQEANAALVADMGLAERRKLLYSLADSLTRLSGRPATVVGATVLARGGGYLFCGGAIYGGAAPAMFILDTRPGATAMLKADRNTWIAAGCELPATTLR